MSYVLDLSVNEGQSFVGIITDAVMIEKYHEMGDPSYGPPIPDDWEGMPGIRITREGIFNKVKEIVFKDHESRDRMFKSLVNQIHDQHREVHTNEKSICSD